MKYMYKIYKNGFLVLLNTRLFYLKDFTRIYIVYSKLDIFLCLRSNDRNDRGILYPGSDNKGISFLSCLCVCLCVVNFTIAVKNLLHG